MQKQEIKLKAGDHLILAAKKQAEGELEVHKANIKVYQTMPAGIGEHSDIIQTIIKELEQVAKYEELLQTLDKHFKKEQVYIDENK